MSGPKRGTEKLTDVCRKLVMRNIIICTVHHILSGWWNRGGWDGRSMWHTW